jgi:hypothetical protein
VSRGRDTEWISVTVRAVTERAVLLWNGKNEAWVPRSRIIDTEADLERGVATKVELDVAFAEDKGLV